MPAKTIRAIRYTESDRGGRSLSSAIGGDGSLWSPSRQIGIAVNELLDAPGSERAADLLSTNAADLDNDFTAPEPVSWITSAPSAAAEQGCPWIGDEEHSARTGMMRTYAVSQVTGTRAVTSSLTGLRFSHKDNIGIAGHPLTAGNASLKDWRSTITSPLLSAVEAAGASLVGANHMAEFAMSPTGHNHWFGDGLNPIDETRYCGGSSSGSAISVARGTCDVSFGTDTGGSVRLPAAFCGLYGYKPTNSLFSHEGLYPLSESLDTIGLIARDLEHLMATTEVLFADESVVAPARQLKLDVNFAEQGHDSAHLSVEGMKRLCDPSVARAYEAVLRALGARAELSIDLDYGSLERKSVVVVSVEAARNVGRAVGWNWDRVGDQVLSRSGRGTAVPALDYADALLTRARSTADFIGKYLKTSRFLLMPTSPVLAPKLASFDDRASESVRRDYMRASEFTRFTNYLGLPAITIPLPGGPGGLPPALQILGRPFDDRALLHHARNLVTTIQQ